MFHWPTRDGSLNGAIPVERGIMKNPRVQHDARVVRNNRVM